jgi:mRNA deadenylase 3'-5' endonuclease subunit Ccr4
LYFDLVAEVEFFNSSRHGNKEQTTKPQVQKSGFSLSLSVLTDHQSDYQIANRTHLQYWHKCLRYYRIRQTEQQTPDDTAEPAVIGDDWL